MRGAPLLALLWLAAAQTVAWTDCGEGPLCGRKADCADACADEGCGPCEDRSCAHVEPSSDVDRADTPLPDALAVEPLALEPDVVPPTGVPGPDAPENPPRPPPRPILLQTCSLLL